MTCSIGFRLGVVLLAAGKSSRMGSPKLLLPWRGTSVLGHLCRQWQAQGAAQVSVVVAAADALLARELDRLGVAASGRIVNSAPERGMFSSIVCAASWGGWQPGLSHWALALGDQPHLLSGTLAHLLRWSVKNPGRICQPAYRSRARHPVILPQAAFEALSTTAAKTLKNFLSDYDVALCEIDDAGLDLDLDVPADYEQALKRFGSE